MRIFIDTNIFLSFYDLTDVDLEALRMLAVLVKDGKVTIYLPEQVKIEYERNREKKISVSLDNFKKQSMNLKVPVMCHDYDEFTEIRNSQKALQTAHLKLVEKVTDDVQKRTLKADIVIQELFGRAELVITTDAILDRASSRVELGNPPGKQNSLGDAISWESLKEAVPEKEELIIIADDNDYYSPLDDTRLKDFLQDEWKTDKSSEIVFHRRLASFFQANYPDVKFATELERQIAVRRFVGCESFADTHAAIARLNIFDDFTDAEINSIAKASISNSQINFIIGDQDVWNFLVTLYNNYRDRMESDFSEALAREFDFIEDRKKRLQAEMENDVNSPF